jgi:V/A-type H+/Na+-transporting ATPase subunit I
MIRPEPARWFEILAAEEDAACALEALATTGAIELEAKPTATLPSDLAELRPMLRRYADFAQRYRAYWPKPGLSTLPVSERPTTTLARCLTRIAAWSADAEDVIVRMQANERERAELELWQRVLGALAFSNMDLGDLARSGPLIDVRLFVFPPEVEPALPPHLPVRRFVIDKALHALAVGTAEELQPIELQAAALKGRTCAIPSWLQTDRDGNKGYVASRLAALEREDAELKARLVTLHARHELQVALGDASRLQWVIDNVHALDTSDVFCWITGWTSELSGDRLAASLDRIGVRAILHYPSAPAGAKPPLVLANPAWAQPFEVFSRALGMPSRDEADPTALLAIVVPIMFGYMFGDLGQGLVIAALGYALRKRWPLARLFVTGGLAAACFGLLFGSVFSLGDIVRPLWVEPLIDPLAVLLVPLYGGATLLTVGLLLTALEAYWRRELKGWFCSEVWLVVVYVSLLAGILRPEAFRVAAAAAILFCLGRALAQRRAIAALGAVGELIERTLQIVINTLSFSRIGAFALAHAGLSSAIVALMNATGGTALKALVLVLGNIIVLVLEGLVVSIQTTRLVLFEFFTRFLVARGRVFRPLPLPPSVVQEH